MRRVIVPSIIFFSAFLFSCGSSRDGVIRDDVYYSPKDEAPVDKSADAGDDFKTEKYDLKLDEQGSYNTRGSRQYDYYEDDFSYSYRINRFRGFYNPYYYSPGWNWSIGYSNYGSYYSMGWGCDPYSWAFCDPWYNPYYPYNAYYNGFYQGYWMGQYNSYYYPAYYSNPRVTAPRRSHSSNLPSSRGNPRYNNYPSNPTPSGRSTPRWDNERQNNPPQQNPSNTRPNNPRRSGNPDINNQPPPRQQSPAPNAPRNNGGGGTNRPRR